MAKLCLVRTQKREMGLAMMLFCVVIVFFFCNILALVVNLLEVRVHMYRNTDQQGSADFHKY
jgi:hypothetical protein